MSTINFRPEHLDESPWTRRILITVALLFLATFLLMPVVLVFSEALRKGWALYFAAIVEPDALSAIRLTLFAALIVLPFNLLFGLAAAWAITKFQFRGKQFLITLIDLPFSVSLVVAGLVLILLFGSQGWFGPWLQAHDLKVVYAVPGVIIATLFVTFPFVARSGHRGRAGRADTGRQWRENFWICDLAQHKMGFVVWCHSCQCSSNGRVRCGGGGLWRRARAHQHHDIAHQDFV